MELATRRLCVRVGDDVLLQGELYRDIKADNSTWFVVPDQGILEVSMLKRNRRGHYSNGATNADTFWFALLSGSHESDRIKLTNPPNKYYWQPYEADDLAVITAAAARRPLPAVPPPAANKLLNRGQTA